MTTLNEIEWEEAWDAHDDGTPHCYDVGYLGNYSATVTYSGACIHYGGLPAEIGVSITLDVRTTAIQSHGWVYRPHALGYAG